LHQIVAAGEGFDFHIVEIGGTVGDYESLAFLEAIASCAAKSATKTPFMST